MRLSTRLGPGVPGDDPWLRGITYGALASLLVLSACRYLPKTAASSAPGGDPLGNVTSSVHHADAAGGNVTAAAGSIESRDVADVTFISDTNQQSADGHPKTLIGQTTTTILARHPNVQPDPTQTRENADRRVAEEEGKVKAAQDLADRAVADAKRSADDKHRADVDYASAIAKRDQQIKDTDTDITKEREDAVKNAQVLQDRVKKAQDDAAQAVQSREVKGLLSAAALCLVVFVVAVGFGGLAGLSKAWPLLLGSVLSLGLAQVVSQWWFKWAVLVSCLVGVGVGIWWVIRHIREGNLKAAAEQQAARLTTATGILVPTLDDAYEKASQSEKEFMDKVIFDPLSSKMGPGTKSLIHTIRATL